MSIKVEQLFANDIHRRIEEVIKVDQTDEQIVREEISEYLDSLGHQVERDYLAVQ